MPAGRTEAKPPAPLPSARARIVATLFACLSALSGGTASAQRGDDTPLPEAPTGRQSKTSVFAPGAIAATANPHATRAANAILARGGSAIDAAIAAQAVLTLVEPQSSGIGGGAFALVYDRRDDTVTAWDGRETAPAAADERLFRHPDGQPMTFPEAIASGRAVGVPGVLPMLRAAHRRHGKLPWRWLFEPAIALAREGFDLSPRLHALLQAERLLAADPAARALFYDTQGRAHPVGHRLRNPALADTLEAVARDGETALQVGPIADAIRAAIDARAGTRGLMTASDLADYRPVARAPICHPWRAWIVCGMPPPSSGGIAVAQILALMDASGSTGLAAPVAAGATGPGEPRYDPVAVHRFAEAGRLAYADRARYVADPDFVPAPARLLAADYLAARAALIGERSLGTAPAADPRVIEYPERGTSHLSIVDDDGNAVALTSSIESAFGSRLMVGGFLLNNQLTDFSFTATEAGLPVANRIAARKRPRSSMAPTLVFDRRTVADGAATDAARGPLAMVTGSPGGAAIINYVARTLILTLQDGLDPQVAIDAPNLGSRNGPTELEPSAQAPMLRAALRARGHDVIEHALNSGLHSLVRECRPATDPPTGSPAGPPTCGWRGAADSRREGLASGAERR